MVRGYAFLPPKECNPLPCPCFLKTWKCAAPEWYDAKGIRRLIEYASLGHCKLMSQHFEILKQSFSSRQPTVGSRERRGPQITVPLSQFIHVQTFVNQAYHHVNVCLGKSNKQDKPFLEPKSLLEVTNFLSQSQW